MEYHILVTGCCGFIGSHLTEKLLNEGYRVTGIDNFDPFYSRSIKEKNLSLFSSHPSFRFFETDIRNKDFASSFKHEKLDAVIHLAAKAGIRPSLEDVNGYIDTNITGTANILEFMRNQCIRKIIFTSSSSVYGNSKEVPFSEEKPLNKPISPYAFTKLSGEMLCYNFHSLYGIDVINLRLFTVYGPRQRPDLAIHKFVRLLNEGKPITLYGDGTSSRDYTYVSDTVTGYCGALKFILSNKGIYETLNLGNSQPIELQELITTIGRLMNVVPQVVRDSIQPGDVEVTFADISKALHMLNYKPQEKLEEGLAKFIAWYKSSVK